MTRFQKRVVVLFAHPAFEKSRVNRELVKTAFGIEGVTFRDLYELYPEFNVDPQTEQALLLEHDVLVFQHPFYWYSVPPLLKQSIDLVLEHGWAYGEKGTALQGKTTLHAMTAGGPEAAYGREGYNQHSVRQLTLHFEQTAGLCGMKYLAPFVAHGTHSMTSEQMSAHARDYRRLLEALRDDTVDLASAAGVDRLNTNLDALISPVREGHSPPGP